MFTGLIQELVLVKKISEKSLGGFKIDLTCPSEWTDLKLGESIACDGVCLTLVEFSNEVMIFFVGQETIEKTTFNQLELNQKLNVERSLTLGDRMGGHVVTGHVDGTAKIINIKNDGFCKKLKFKLAPDQFRFVISKGSICINGVSLTINDVNRDEKAVEVYLIPETLNRTNLSLVKAGDLVNIEIDQFVKIIAHQIGSYRELNP